MKKLGLYLHIPFCVRKCSYCDFLSAAPGPGQQEAYVKALCQDITKQGEQYKEYMVDTMFIGGGTPSLLRVEEIQAVMEAVRDAFVLSKDIEITMEMNPGTVTGEKLAAYRDCGINRLSIGLQSANNRELKNLGRIHTWEEFLITWKLVRAAGFDNVNIDVMSALPEQTFAAYSETLEKVLALQPEHISAYSLIVEEGTLFYERYGEEKAEHEKLPTEEADREMYQYTKERLAQAGYTRYEISNYAKEGFACRHNLKYWRREEYLGLGLGASSLIGHVRFRQESTLEEYLEKVQAGKAVTAEREALPLTEEMEEFMFLGLRTMKGISPEEFEKQFGISYERVYGNITKKMISEGLLRQNWADGRIALTEQGIDVSNQIFVEFMEPEVSG